MNIAIFSDLHLNPGDEVDFDFSTFDVVIACGDLLNILPYGIDAWKTEAGTVTIGSIARCVNGAKFVFVVGNHEGRKSWVEELFKGFLKPIDEIVMSYDIKAVDRVYRFRHGHRFALDWNYLRYVADDVVVFMTGWNSWLRNKMWYPICRSRGWMPATDLARVKNLKEDFEEKSSKKYQKNIATVWMKAFKEAHKQNNMTLYIGHTHQPVTIGPTPEFGCEVIDLGHGVIHSLEIGEDRCLQ